MAGEHDLDVFRARVFLQQAGAPVDDAVALGEDRGRGHRQIAGERLDVLDPGVGNQLSRQQLVELADAAGGDVVGERAAERDHRAHRFRHAQRQIARVDAAEAPADQADLALRLFVNEGQTLAQLLAHAIDAAEIAAEIPGVRLVAEPAEVAAKQRRREIAGEKTGQREHGMAVAARRRHQDRASS